MVKRLFHDREHVDVWVARRIEAPIQPELGMGAVAKGGEVLLDAQIVSEVGASEADVEEGIARKAAEVEERCKRLRRGRDVVVILDEAQARGRGPAEQPVEGAVRIPTAEAELHGELAVPAAARARGIVLFAHGSRSSRKSPRNRFVAGVFQRAGLATLSFDLLTADEEAADADDADQRFDINLLARRLVAAADWVRSRAEARNLPIGYFGAGKGAAAALTAAAFRADVVDAVVSRGGRVDLAERVLSRVRAPTLLIVGSDDRDVLSLNRSALRFLRNPKELEIVPSATHLFEEPGTLERLADVAAAWCRRHLTRARVEARANAG